MEKQLLEVTNFAAGQSDRWLFVALLIIGLAAIGILFRYFTARLDSLQDRMDSQTTEFVSHLKTANQEMLAVIASAKAVIERVERKLEIHK
jgi:type VI protein secretion system component VasK